MVVRTSLKDAIAEGGSDIFKDAEDSYRVYFPGEIVRPHPVEEPVISDAPPAP